MSYKLIISKIDSIRKIEGADRIAAATVLGQEVVVGNDYFEGQIVCFAGTDGIFNDEFCIENNLFPTITNGEKKGGYFAPGKARIKAQKFKGVKSCGFAFPLSYLKYTGYDLGSLKVGDQFDELNGHKICSKYISEATNRALVNRAKQGKKTPISLMFHEHKDTEQFRYYLADIPVGAIISLQNKKHGTSFRATYAYQELPLGMFKSLINRFLPIFPTRKREYLLGTRRVVLLPEHETKEGFHGSESFRYDILPLIKNKIPFGYSLYGEITGWANNSPIMPPHSLNKSDFKEILKDYPNPMFFSYGDPQGSKTFSLYHATFSNEDGHKIDLTWPEVKELAHKIGIKHTFELEPEFIYNGNKEELAEKVRSYLDKPDPEDPRHYSEGVIIRYTVGNKVKFLKEKGFYFKLGEGIIKDSSEIIDMEESS